MTRRRLSSFQVYLGVIVVTTILALLPLRHVSWVNDVAAIARVPSMPLTHVGMRIRGWLRGEAMRNGPAPDNAEFLQRELDQYRSLAKHWRGVAEQLAEVNAQLQRTRAMGLDVAFDPVVGDIVARNTQSDRATYELNIGSHLHGVREGAVAVYNGAHVVGRIGSVARLSSVLVPLTDPGFALIRAEVEVSRADADEPFVIVHLENLGDGSFTTQAPRDAGVEVGDYVYLHDPDWPRTAQAMIIGSVRSIEPDAETPVLMNLVVRPVYSPDRLNAVMVKVEDTASNPGGSIE